MSRIFVFGDDIDTDVIAPGGYLHLGIEDVKKHCMEAIYPDFWKDVSKGDIIVAGKNFGTGSSREQAPVVLMELGISLILATSFARIFFRNAVNVGLPIGTITGPLEFKQGDDINFDLEKGELIRAADHKAIKFKAPSGALADILSEGGIIPYTLKKLGRLPDEKR